MASPLDDNSQPPPTDPSAYTEQPADPTPALLNLSTLPEANEGALELVDGAHGDRDTVRIDNVLPPALQTSDRYPTNGKPSPLFGAQPFTQQLLLFEEFGPEKLDPTTPAPELTFPVPTSARPRRRTQRRRAQRAKWYGPGSVPQAARPVSVPEPVRQCAGPQPLEGADRNVPQPPAGRLAC